ncbi:MAG: hypothetical protein HYS27_10220 [Deltaproteobacteria bacterium]|nr:hypothetical protein [Deltaproteobacteria bacterium]
MSDGPKAEPADGSAKKRPKTEMRVPRYQGSAPPPPVPLSRLRAVPGTEPLQAGDAGPDHDELLLPDGALGAAELALGRADPLAAAAAVAVDGVSDIDRRAVQARAALMQGDLEAARAALGSDREAEALALADAALSLAEGDAARAARRVADALFRRPNGLAERYLLALVKVAEGDLEEAQTSLAAVARASPTHAVARYQLGQLLLAAGDPARAGTLFEMAWLLQPGFTAPAMALAEMLVESRQHGEALNLIGQLTETAPEALAPRVLQLRVLLDVGEREAALQLAELLRDKVPGHAEITLLYAEALSENERPDEARAIVEKLVAAGITDTTLLQRARRQLARIALAERPPRSEEALTMLKAAVRAGGALAGELCIELFHVSVAVGRRNDAEEALELLSQSADVGAVISGAILARSHAMWAYARKLAELARAHVAGTPAEAQLEGFLATLP